LHDPRVHSFDHDLLSSRHTLLADGEKYERRSKVERDISEKKFEMKFTK